MPFLLLLYACTTPTPVERSDIDRYTDLVSTDHPDPRAALRECGELPRSDLAGDCALAVVVRAEATGNGSFGSLCPEVPSGLWRDECWFLGAEDRLREGRREDAADACRHAGRLELDCSQHLWQDELSELMASNRTRDLVGLQLKAEAIYQRWAPLLPDTDIEWRFWNRFYGWLMMHSTVFDLGFCNAWTDREQHLRCRDALAHLYQDDLLRILGNPHRRQQMCRLESPTVQSVARLYPSLAASPDPLLDALLQRHHRQVCHSELPAPEDPLIGAEALERALVEEQ